MCVIKYHAMKVYGGNGGIAPYILDRVAKTEILPCRLLKSSLVAHSFVTMVTAVLGLVLIEHITRESCISDVITETDDCQRK
jgi:hypothetical protein